MKDTEESGPENERIEDPNANTVTVDLEEPDDDDDEEGGEEPAPRAAKGDKDQPRDKSTGKWTQKKQERQREHKERTAWREEKAAFERRMADERAAFQRQLAELTARTAAPQQSQQTPSDPYDAKLNDIEAAMEAELKLIEADESRGLKRYNQLRRDEQRLLIEQSQAKLVQAQRAAQAAAPQRNTQYDARAPFIEAEYPWTMDPRCKDLNSKAWAYRSYLINVEGRPDTIDTDREALSHIQAKFGASYGLQPPARPSRDTRDRYVRPAQGGPAERDGGRPSRMEIPAHLVEGSGLDAAALARALREG